METNLIEEYDEKRRKFLLGHIIGFIIFFCGWMIRFNLKLFQIEIFILELIGFIIFFIGFVIQAFHAIKKRILVARLKRDPFIYNAIFNELDQHYRLKSWYVEFISIILFLTIVLVLEFYFKTGDLTIIIITALMIGFGSYNLVLYSLYYRKYEG